MRTRTSASLLAAGLLGLTASVSGCSLVPKSGESQGPVIDDGNTVCGPPLVATGRLSPSDPKAFDASMLNAPELAKIADLDDRAEVMGHAIGAYLMGKTLPKRVIGSG